MPPDRLALIDDPSAAVPRDFAVDVLVLTGDRRPAGDRVHERPLRVTLSADGSVHAALDEEISGRTPPVRIRTVDRATVAAIWTEARALGLLDPDLDAPPVHPASIRSGPEELVAVVDVRAEGRHRTVVERADGPRRLAPDVAGFVRTLAELAWAVDRPDRGVRVVPRRYDLGADPYARYRPPTVGAARGDV